MDTLAYAKRLKAAGISDSQAEVHANAFSQAIESPVPSKARISGQRNELKAGLAAFRTELTARFAPMHGQMVTKLDIAELEVRLTYCVAGMLAVAVTILSVVSGVW